MKVFSATYGDLIKFDEKPNEDFYLVSKKIPIFVVADGVTQSHFENGKYAFPNGAKEAAEIFCYKTLEVLEKEINNDLSERKVKEIFIKAFNFANDEIKKLNIKNGIDKKLNYVEYDWFDTVGIAGFILKNKIYYGYVGDCGLIIFDKLNKKKFQTKDMVAPAVKKFMKVYEKNGMLLLNERTLIIHKNFRNNPNKQGYGSFSGEKGVKNYYKFGSQKLSEKDLLVFYSDGFANYLDDGYFVKIIRGEDKKILDKFVAIKALKNHKKYGTDRTFVSIVFNKK